MIVVEDGTGLTTSNSYCSADSLIQFALERRVELNQTEAEQCLILACDFIGKYETRFLGGRKSPHQALSFPRTGFATIPYQLIRAQKFLALDEARGLNLMTQASSSGEYQSIDIGGAISVTYPQNSNANSFVSDEAQHSTAFAQLNQLFKTLSHRTVRA